MFIKRKRLDDLENIVMSLTRELGKTISKVNKLEKEIKLVQDKGKTDRKGK